MDSRMLNVFHEDPFEGNFVKYDSESNFWSANDDLQLTDTLNGILPIAPTDESLLSENTTEEQLQNNNNLLIYSDFVEQQLSDDTDVLNSQIYKQQRQLTVLINSEDEEEAGGELDDHDIQSQCSNSTFRTRTDSSSIGDYESHSSDYDDEIDDYPDVNFAGQEHQLKTDAFELENDRKNRTISTNTISSEGDALGLNIDVNNFDLADFITKDDFTDVLGSQRAKSTPSAMPVTTSPLKLDIVQSTAKKAKEIIAASPLDIVLPKPVIISSKNRDSDYDSDSIIDVETVDVIEADESLYTKCEKPVAVDDLCYVDNVKDDPSWSPKQTKRLITAENKTVTANNQLTSKATSISVPPAASAAATAAKAKVANSICLVPNKKQCDFLKRKVGAKANGHLAISKTKVAAKKIQEANKSVAGKQQQVLAKTTDQVHLNTGLGLGGKNLALLKQEHNALAVTPSDAVAIPAPKRKLNLEEYKQRRCGVVGAIKLPSPATPTPAKQAKLEISKTTIAPKPISVQQSSPHKEAICSIVNSLKCPTSQVSVATDPITVAKNKVLRMLELKRAQQLKIIDSRVTAKVPRVTKLPPLKDIVKDTYCMEIETETVVAPVQPAACSNLQADYEEIIIVSASCNTDITIPPQQASVALRNNKTTPSSRSLLRSSVLLYNMSNGSEAGKDMTNSLIASIQSEVVKQTSCAVLANPTTTALGTATSQSNNNEDHGEDKVIMHLAKNRLRKIMVSMGTQTDLQPEFPLLTLPTTRQSRERTRRNYRKCRDDGSASSESSCSTSSSSTCSSIASYRSRSNSIDRLRHPDAAPACGSSIGGGGYSSRSTRRHRSSVSSSSFSEAGKYDQQQRQRQRRTSYNKRRSKNQTRDNCSTSGSEYSDRERSRSPHRHSRSRSTSATRYVNNQMNNNRSFVDRNVSQPAVEERRIVYVGRIETETTKEMLRRKFLPYGSIKQITIHYKETGMKYGFVTYERAQDAFTAIDSSPRDAHINMYDISFGGRRAFCRASYADLDNAGINNYQSYVFPKAAPVAPPKEDSFEALLLKMKAKLNANKPAAAQTTTASKESTQATASTLKTANNAGSCINKKNKHSDTSQI